MSRTLKNLVLLTLSFSLGIGSAMSASGHFSKAQTLTSHQNRQPVTGSRVVVNDSGQMLAVWQQANQLQARAFSGGIWGQAAAITQQADTASLLDLAESAQGQGLAVFFLISGGQTAAQYSFFANSSWTAPQAIPSTPGFAVLNARAAFDAQGMATMLWVEKNGAACAVMTVTGSAASGWNTPQHLGDGCLPYIQLSENSAGEAVVGLGAPGVGRHGGSPWIVGGRNKAGDWSALTNLGTGEYATAPSVTISENGAAVATFSDASLGVLYSRRSQTDGSWSTPDIVYGAVPAVATAVAMSKNGTAVVVFNGYYTNVPPAPLLSSTLPKGSFQWSAPVYVTDPSSEIDTFTVKATPAGTFAVGWSGYTTGASGSSTGASLLGPGTNNWTTTVLDNDASGSGTYPSPFSTDVAVASGHVAALWNNYDKHAFAIDVIKASTAKVK